MNCSNAVKSVLSVSAALRGLGDAEIDDLGHRHAVVQRDQDVRRLDVAMDDPFLMRVLDRLADLDEQLEPLVRGEIVLVAVIGDLHAAHQFHDEVGPARFGRARVENFGDVRMIHQRQRLPLGFEPGDDLLGVHAQLDDLQRHPPPHRFLLLGHIDDAAAAFADLLEQLVTADPVAGPFQSRAAHGLPEGLAEAQGFPKSSPAERLERGGLRGEP